MTAATLPVATCRPPPAAGRWFGCVRVPVPDRVAGGRADRSRRPTATWATSQKIMYVHVPAAWIMMLSFFVVLVLQRALPLAAARERRSARGVGGRGRRDVQRAHARARHALGRPTWGVWWTWDARLTSTLVLFLIFVGYLVAAGVRRRAGAPRAMERGGRDPRRDQRADRVHVGALVAHAAPGAVEPVDRGSALRAVPAARTRSRSCS